MFTSLSFARVALAVCAPSLACDVFDPKLYQALSMPDGGRETKVIADRCERDVPLQRPSESSFLVDTSGMTGDYRDFVECLGEELPGNDGFVRVEMAAGEKWHVHVDPQSPELDPAIYVLPNCDVRSCRRRSAHDACGAGQSEHLSFVAESTGPHLIGLDSRRTGGGRLSVIVTRPVCGNGGVPEHSEACDDGNTRSGDGCDACRWELDGQSVREEEPNEYPQEANVVVNTRLSSAATEIAGMLGNRCGDLDVFAVEMVAGGHLQALLRGRDGACDLPGAQLTLLGPDGLRELGDATPAIAGQGCLAIDDEHAFARSLAAGTYYLRVSTANTAAFSYQLQVGQF